MNKKEKLGCFYIVVAILRLIIVTPLYYILMYFILDHIQATPFIWSFFWVYVPFGLLFAVFTEVVSLLMKREESK